MLGFLMVRTPVTLTLALNMAWQDRAAKADRTRHSASTARSAFALALHVPSGVQCCSTTPPSIAWPLDELAEGPEHLDKSRGAGAAGSGVEALPPVALRALYTQLEAGAKDAMHEVLAQIAEDQVEVWRS